jgi:hypothetical protein
VAIMKRIIALALLTLSPLANSIEYREELAPPNVDFYLELMATRLDYKRFGGNSQDGFRIRGGMDLKDVTWGRWMLRLEGGLNRFGDNSTSTVDEQRVTSGLPDFIGPGTITTIDDLNLRLGGIEVGARLYDSELFFVRGGGFLYNLKQRDQRTVLKDPDNSPALPPNTQVPNEESFASVGPYLGAGIEFDLVPSVRAVLEFDVYRVEGENLNNLNLGLQFRF